MKFVVIGLGVLIFVALGLIAARLVMLASEGQPARAIKAVTPVQRAIPLQRAIDLAIPADASVKSISLAGGRLAVHYGDGTGAAEAIAVVDLGNGRVVSRIRIKPKAPKQ